MQTLPSSDDDERSAARANGFSLHAGVVAAVDQRDKLERLCRYITRPAVSTERLSLTTHGHIHYRLKTPYRDGTTHVVFEPLDFLSRLAARVPNPRVNLTRYHGVFAPNHHLREQVTSARRGRRHAVNADRPPPESHAAMTWTQRLKRVFKIEIETCETCGGKMKVIAAIEDPAVIKRILAHLDNRQGAGQHPEHPPRAPPQLMQPGLLE